MSNKIEVLTVLTVLLVLLALGALMAYADGPSAQPGVIMGEVVNVEKEVIPLSATEAGEDNPLAQPSPVEGEVVDVQKEVILVPATEGAGATSSVEWTRKSVLNYYDYGEYEDVSGRSESSTDQPVYQLRVLGELYRNGNRLWNNTVTNCCNVTSVSSGNSPYYRGYNAFWESKGTHWLKATSGSSEIERTTSVTKQF